MKMRAGRLRHRAELQQSTETRDAYGSGILTWTTTTTVWAAIEPLSGKEYFSQSQTQNEAGVRIVIRYYSGIDETWRLVSGGKTYVIESVINENERDRMMVLMCLEGVKTT